MMEKILPGKFILAMIGALIVIAGVGNNPVFGSETVSGVVAEAGFGSFVLETKNGEMFTLNTGGETTYEPDDFRPRQGDEVEATYYEKDLRGKMVQAVSLLKLIKLNQNFKEPANPAEGVIKATGGKWFNIFIPAINRSFRFEIARNSKVNPKGWNPAADDNVKITYKRVASPLTGSYVYQIEIMEKM